MLMPDGTHTKPHHEWGDESFDWEGLNKAIDIIEKFVHRAGGPLIMMKEKYGTARITIYPSVPECFHQTSSYDQVRLNKVATQSINYQYKVLNRAYQIALKKFPHLREEILVDTIGYEEFIDGAKEVVDKYWTQTKNVK